MNNAYQAGGVAQKYLSFLNSKNGRIQQKVLSDAILGKLENNPQLKILDAGSGPGWLSGMLKKKFANVEACDDSEFFIQFAKQNYPNVNFKIAKLEEPLPYENYYFDAVILNMVAPDLENLENSFKNISLITKPDGYVILTVPNPKYTYPAAVWKRGILDILFGRKPHLKLKNPPAGGFKVQREFGKDVKIDSYFYTMSDYINNALKAGLLLTLTQEIRSMVDSEEFDLSYQLHRYPLFLLLQFKKI